MAGGWSPALLRGSFRGAPPTTFESKDGVAHVGPVSPLVSPQGLPVLLTGGLVDSRVSMWDAASGRRMATAQMGGTLMAILADPGRARAIAVDEGGRVSSWPITIKALQRELSAATSAHLTPSERMDLLGEPADVAYERYAEAERRSGRTPLPITWRFKLPF